MAPAWAGALVLGSIAFLAFAAMTLVEIWRVLREIRKLRRELRELCQELRGVRCVLKGVGEEAGCVGGEVQNCRTLATRSYR